MQAAYSEMLERIRQEGLYRAGRQRAPAEDEAAQGEGPDENREWKAIECEGCWYWRMLDYTMGLKACWYPLLENRLRPCLPTDCYQKPGTPYRPCGPQEACRPDAGQTAGQAAGQGAGQAAAEPQQKAAAEPQQKKEGSD